MHRLTDLRAYPVSDVLDRLLEDKTTRRSIVFASDDYARLGAEYGAGCRMSARLLENMTLDFSREADAETVKAAVDASDEKWFGRSGAFDGAGVVKFTKRRRPRQYVDTRRFVTLRGSAEFIAERYDPRTGEIIPVRQRASVLDRKLRVVGENAGTKEEWFKWAYRALEATYGSEYRGDRLFICRVNVLLTFADFMADAWGEKPTRRELAAAANIIAWNLWQMDGSTGFVPLSDGSDCAEAQGGGQMDMSFFASDAPLTESPSREALIHDRRSKRTFTFNSLKTGERRMKFECIPNGENELFPA